MNPSTFTGGVFGAPSRPPISAMGKALVTDIQSSGPSILLQPQELTGPSRFPVLQAAPRWGAWDQPAPFDQVPPQYALGDSEDDLGQLGFSLGKTVKNIGNTVKKAVVDTGHVAGKVVTSKVGQAVIGTALAATGVGIPAAAAIMGGSKAIGNLIKPGGNLKSAATGAYQGALTGAAFSVGGSVARKVVPKGGSVVKAGVSKVFNRGGSAASTAGGAVVDQVLNRGIPPVSVIPETVATSPEVMQQQVRERADRAAGQARARQAQAQAEAARAEAARRAAELQAQLQAAQAAANDQQAAILQAQLEQARAQAEAATRAAQAAQSAQQTAASDQGGLDQIMSAVNAAVAAAQAAQAAAAAPPTPQATAAVQQAADYATGYAADAAAGTAEEPQQASILGGLENVNPIVLIGGVALIAMMTSSKGGRRRARR
jgi:hypothetical protein